jgi:hypothetical protein
VNITLKVPDFGLPHDQAGSKIKGRSLNAQVIQILAAEAAHAERLRKLANARQEFDRFAASLPPIGDLTRLIREDRER